MKLSRLYSNQDNKFQPINFKDGLNVLYANVALPKENDKDSHNLGKTTLLRLIDYMLMRQFASGHFLYEHEALFNSFVFYLELELNYGSYVTIRRSVAKNTEVSIVRHTEAKQNFAEFQLMNWDFEQISLGAAKEALSGILRLEVLHDYNYRRGLGYILRTQSDFDNVFDVNRYSHGRDANWKPFLAMLFGFDYNAIKRKYHLDNLIKQNNDFRSQYEKEAGVNVEQLDRIKQMIEIRQSEVTSLRAQADRFNYYAQDQKISADLVGGVETKISGLNDRLYVINYEVQSIDQSSPSVPKFNVNKVEKLFQEAQIYFPDQLRKSYDDLLNFNKRMSQERTKWLRKRRRELVEERATVQDQLQKLNLQREEMLSTLREEEWFLKYRAIQSDLSQREKEVVRLEADRERTDIVSKYVREAHKLNLELGEVVNTIQDNVSQGTPILQVIRSRFYSIIRDVLERPAVLTCQVNKKDNIDFDVEMMDAGLIMGQQLFEQLTSEGEGTSYKKILCAAFDMSLHEAYANDYYYRFLYHDGILEGLDNRKKLRLLDAINEFCDAYGLQYILTVLDSDAPRDDSGNKIPFPPESIIRTFHEDGSEGRLFNMPKF